MDKAIYVGFAILELSKLHMYETYYDTLQPYFGQEKLWLNNGKLTESYKIGIILKR